MMDTIVSIIPSAVVVIALTLTGNYGLATVGVFGTLAAIIGIHYYFQRKQPKFRKRLFHGSMMAPVIIDCKLAHELIGKDNGRTANDDTRN